MRPAGRSLRAALLCLTIVGWDRVAAQESQDDLIERGRYLAHDVAMCVQCHTPRTPSGELDETRLFGGAPVPVEAPPFVEAWALQAPAIAGLPGLSDEDEIALLTTGKRPASPPPDPPMPPFRLSREDAKAIVAYLRSLDDRGEAEAADAPRSGARERRSESPR